MTPKQQRLWYLFLLGLVVCGAVLIILTTVKDHLLFFATPSDIFAKKTLLSQHLRLGGVVAKGSLKRQDDGFTITFMVTDFAHEVPVVYQGVIPDLFREEQGVVVEGKVNKQGQFIANRLLAKHDENYMPAEVAQILKANGQWRPSVKSWS